MERMTPGTLWRATWMPLAVVLTAAVIGCRGPSVAEKPPARTVVAEGDWEGGQWRLLDVGPAETCLTLEPLSSSGCTSLSSVDGAQVQPLLQGGGLGDDAMHGRFVVAIGPRSMDVVEVHGPGVASARLALTKVPGHNLKAVVYVARPDAFEHARLVVRHKGGQKAQVVPIGD